MKNVAASKRIKDIKNELIHTKTKNTMRSQINDLQDSEQHPHEHKIT